MLPQTQNGPPASALHFALRATSPPRNKSAGHGAGVLPATEPSIELPGYVLHMAAATVLFLTEAEKKLP